MPFSVDVKSGQPSVFLPYFIGIAESVNETEVGVDWDLQRLTVLDPILL